MTYLPPRTRIVDEDPEARHVRALQERCDRLNLRVDIARAILDLADGWEHDAQSAKRDFTDKRQVWERSGGYIKPISTEDILGWFSTGSCFLAEAAAPGSSAGDPFVAVAQRLFRMPSTQWVIPTLQEPDDEILDRPRYEALVGDGPKCCVASDYAGVVPEWAGYRLAREASHTGLMELIRRNSSRSRDAQLSSVVGTIFAVQGLDVLAGHNGEIERAIRLDDFDEGEIANRASMCAFTRTRRRPVHLIAKWRTAPGVPLTIDGRRHALRVDWYMAFQSLRGPDTAPAG